MTLTVTPSGQACGARIEGIDLTQDLTDSQIAELRQLWLEHKVIALPNQALTPEDLERVAQYFGDVGKTHFSATSMATLIFVRFNATRTRRPPFLPRSSIPTGVLWRYRRRARHFWNHYSSSRWRHLVC